MKGRLGRGIGALLSNDGRKVLLDRKPDEKDLEKEYEEIVDQMEEKLNEIKELRKELTVQILVKDQVDKTNLIQLESDYEDLKKKMKKIHFKMNNKLTDVQGKDETSVSGQSKAKVENGTLPGVELLIPEKSNITVQARYDDSRVIDGTDIDLESCDDCSIGSRNGLCGMNTINNSLEMDDIINGIQLNGYFALPVFKRRYPRIEQSKTMKKV